MCNKILATLDVALFDSCNCSDLEKIAAASGTRAVRILRRVSRSCLHAMAGRLSGETEYTIFMTITRLHMKCSGSPAVPRG